MPEVSLRPVTRENVRAMRKLEELSVAQRTLADRIAEFVAKFCGSITFVLIHAVLFAALCFAGLIDDVGLNPWLAFALTASYLLIRV